MLVSLINTYNLESCEPTIKVVLMIVNITVSGIVITYFHYCSAFNTGTYTVGWFYVQLYNKFLQN